MKSKSRLKGDIKIGTRIKQYRMERHLTQKDLGELVHVSASSITRLERGESMVSVFTMMEISVALNVPISAILTNQYQNEFNEEELNGLIAKLQTCTPYQRSQLISGIELILNAVFMQ